MSLPLIRWEIIQLQGTICICSWTFLTPRINAHPSVTSWVEWYSQPLLFWRAAGRYFCTSCSFRLLGAVTRQTTMSKRLALGSFCPLPFPNRENGKGTYKLSLSTSNICLTTWVTGPFRVLHHLKILFMVLVFQAIRHKHLTSDHPVKRLHPHRRGHQPRKSTFMCSSFS